MAIEYTKTIRGITYTQGQSFKARAAGTWYGSSDGTGGSGSIASGHTCYFQFYQADYSWQIYNYCINPNSSGASEYEWTNINIFPYATYSITYNANGGSGAPSKQTKTWGTDLTLSTTSPTRTGYTFKGWGTSASATTATYQPGGTYSANAAATLYAVWQVNTYTVSYNANGGSGAPSSQTKTYGQTLTLSTTVPTRTGYNFLGWSTSSTATTATYQAGGSYTTNAAATLYAVWQLKTYTVSFNANGGSGAPANQTKTYGVNLTLSSTIPTRTGYTFKGWGTSSSATTATYQAGGTYSANSAATLYAVWQINTYTVSYNANGGSNAPSSQTKTYGVDLTLSSTTPTRTDYTFKGWATSSTGAVAYSAGGTYKDNASITLYAVWEGVAPTVTQNVTIASSTKLNLSATANATCNLWRYKLDGGSWTTFSSTSGTSATGTLTVTAGSHTVQIAARRSSNSVYGYGTTQTLDTSLPTVSFTASNIDTNSFTITATTNVNCNQWWYSLDGGTTWVSYSTTNTTSTTKSITGLNVNTTYNVKVRAKKTSNNLTGDSSAQSVSTQGGIAHIRVNGVWKDAIPYVKIGSAWKQSICYTKVGSSWRINT